MCITKTFYKIFFVNYKMLILLALIIILIYLIPVYQEPRILKGVLTSDECEYIIDKSKGKLKLSTIGKERKLDENYRVSETAWLDLKDPMINKIAKKCLKNIDRPISNCENLQVVRYKPGGFYAPHHDAFKNEKNKRMYTFIMALNDDYQGGETYFTEINKSYKLAKGDCLLFDNLDNYNFITSKAVHQGTGVDTNEKWICNLWVHIYPYN